jgi:uncharacterized protein YbjT (DUF2867 family)
MTILVVGGTGKVGTHLLRHLLEQQQAVRVLVRTPERAALVPQPAEAFVADVVEDPEAASAAFQGVDAVFMLNAISPQETVEGLLVLALANAAGVKRFVYQSAHSLSHLHSAPHVGAKLVIEEAVKSSGLEYTIISPNHFFQNDDDLREALLQYGTYLNPIGAVGCWRVDVRDIAEAAARVLTSGGHEGKNYALIGPENLTGSGCAEIWAHALGRPVRYEGDIGAYQTVLGAFLPRWLVFDLGLMLAEIGKHGMLGNADELDALTTLLGRPPRRYDDYVAECAANWQVAAP